MSAKEHQGQQAVKNGKSFEDELANKLRYQLGYVEFPTLPELFRTQPFFVRQCKGLVQNIYGGPLALDFYLSHPQKHPAGLIIEAKYQERGGSIDEKLYFTIGSLIATGIPSLLLLIGNGVKKPARTWCLKQQIPGRLTVLADWADFLRLINKGYL